MKKIIEVLKEKYGGEWKYHRQGHYWEHVNKGYVRRVAILGGRNGDDIIGSELIYYPRNRKSERIFL
jgi:CTP:phosphocholine cytidylyltransferase-like protein